MSGYVPKVGDRVRATLGENVLVGVVTDSGLTKGVGEQWVTVDVTASEPTGDLWLWLSDGWQFEQVVEVPSKLGAVIRRADGEVFFLADPNSADDTDWFGADSGWQRSSEATAGGFTVLFEGVDE